MVNGYYMLHIIARPDLHDYLRTAPTQYHTRKLEVKQHLGIPIGGSVAFET
jgi:hypothetical protein